jgi:hypothetical protein
MRFDVSTMNFAEQTAIAIERFSSSFRAWVKSVVISWLVLFILFSCFALAMSGWRIDPRNWVALMLMSSMFHIGAYSLIGIPFFAAFWPQDQSCVWRIRLSLPIGAFLGYFGMWLVLSILDSRPVNLLSDVAGGCLYGAAYGAVTAFVASKLKSANKPAHTTAGNAPV